MILQICIAILFLCIVLPFGAYYISEVRQKEQKGQRRLKKFKKALLFNAVSFFAVLGFSTIVMFSGTAVAETTSVASNTAGMAYIAAALSTGLGSIAAGIATGSAASAALGALSENEGIMSKAIIFVALAEGIAIYGVVVSFMILGRV